LTKPTAILITGASGAIGGALAREYAAPGVHLILHGRNRQALDQLAADCVARGARISIHCADLRDVGGLRQWARQLAEHTPPDLVIANAGMNINIGPRGEGEHWEDIDALWDVNVRSLMGLIEALLPVLRQRRQGQIVLVSSLAGYFGVPLTPSYSASKAAIKSYGEALRGWLLAEGIRVNVVMPGYVDSAMCHAMPGPKPLVWSAERAARKIREGIARDKARISFPFPLNLGAWCLAVLPVRVSLRLMRWIGYAV
jgi:short-subunit dehydrogenase